MESLGSLIPKLTTLNSWAPAAGRDCTVVKLSSLRKRCKDERLPRNTLEITYNRLL